ncbi:MAG TPA: alpha/beta hydrolase [Polyangia bacterium]|nr:alpha/beta hydrolase [Polyangia bacterium]
MSEANHAPSRPSRWRRWALLSALLILALVVAGIFSQLRADLPLEVVRARWATGSSRFAEVDGMQVHYRDEGSGATILLLHGTSASLHTWDGWTSELARRYRVVRLDLPAFGLTGPSPARDYSIAAYVTFLDHAIARLGLASFAVAGNSLGGDIAWHYALAHPDKVRALILVDAAGYPLERGPAPIAFRIARWPLLPRLLTLLDPRVLVEDGLRRCYGDPARIRPGVVDRYLDLTLRPGNRVAFLDRMRTPAIDDSALIKTIARPTLILWGARDRVIDAISAPRFARDIAGSQLVVYDDLGHIPMEEDPTRTVRDAEAFLARIP